MKATWNGATLADSDDTIVVEDNHYFPAESIHAEGRNELLTIDRHKIQPHAGFVGKLIEEAAEESEKVDEATAAEVRREPVSARTGPALADLARSRAELRAIVRVVQHDGVAVGDYPPLLLLRFVEANGGCFRVQSRKPIGG